MTFPAPPPSPEWATNIPSRRGKSFKMHNSKGTASSALSYHFPNEPVQLLRWNGSGWDVEFEYVLKPNCDRCDKPHASHGRRVSERGVGPQWQREVICQACEMDEEVDRYLKAEYHVYLPSTYGHRAEAFKRAQTIPGFTEKWNVLVERKAEADAQKARDAKLIKGAGRSGPYKG